MYYKLWYELGTEIEQSFILRVSLFIIITFSSIGLVFYFELFFIKTRTVWMTKSLEVRRLKEKKKEQKKEFLEATVLGS
jgi:hypothetical protein